MKKFIVKKEQLNEYVERKKADKVFYDIVEALHKNMKYLNEEVSLKGANQTVVDNYKRKGLINSRVNEMLIKYNIIDEKHEII